MSGRGASGRDGGSVSVVDGSGGDGNSDEQLVAQRVGGAQRAVGKRHDAHHRGTANGHIRQEWLGL